MRDLGEEPVTKQAPAPPPPPSPPQETAEPVRAVDPSKPWADMLDPKSTRVLTTSSPRGTPMWVSSLFVGGMTLIFSLPLVLVGGFEMFQPMLSYSILLLAAGSGLWSVYGMTRTEEPPRARKLCGIGLALALLGALLAFVTRNPG